MAAGNILLCRDLCAVYCERFALLYILQRDNYIVFWVNFKNLIHKINPSKLL